MDPQRHFSHVEPLLRRVVWGTLAWLIRWLRVRRVTGPHLVTGVVASGVVWTRFARCGCSSLTRSPVRAGGRFGILVAADGEPGPLACLGSPPYITQYFVELRLNQHLRFGTSALALKRPNPVEERVPLRAFLVEVARRPICSFSEAGVPGPSRGGASSGAMHIDRSPLASWRWPRRAAVRTGSAADPASD